MSSLVQEEYAKERRTRRMEDFQNSSSIDISENEILKYGGDHPIFCVNLQGGV